MQFAQTIHMDRMQLVDMEKDTPSAKLLHWQSMLKWAFILTSQ